MLHTHQTPAESVVQFFRLIFTYQLGLWEIMRKDVYDDFRNASLNKAANGKYLRSFVNKHQTVLSAKRHPECISKVLVSV